MIQARRLRPSGQFMGMIFVPKCLMSSLSSLSLLNCLLISSFLGFLANTIASATAFGLTAPVIGANINLSQLTGNQYEASIAINPKNSLQIITAARNEVGGLLIAQSSDGGTTWNRRLIGQSTMPIAGDIPRAYGNASVAWDEFGNIFLVYISQPSVGSQSIYVTIALSIDGGITFKAPYGLGPALILPNASAPYYSGDQPTVIVGPGSAGYPGSVWITFWSQGGIWTSGAGVSGLGIVSPFTSQPLPFQPSGVNFGDIAIGANGQVIVTYGPNSGTNGAIYTNLDDDGLGPNSFGPYTMVTPVNLGGFDYILAQPNWGIDPEPGLAFDRKLNRVYLVYTDALSIGSMDTNIFVTHSDDNGLSWSAPIQVNDDQTPNSQFLPHIALDASNGSIAITWLDGRNSASNDTAQLFGAISSDGGQTFSANFQISQGVSNQANSIALGVKKTDFGDYTGSAYANGKLFPVWADNSNSTGNNPDGATNFDLYTAVISVPQNPTMVTSAPIFQFQLPSPLANGWFTLSPVIASMTVTSADPFNNQTLNNLTCTSGVIANNVTGAGTPQLNSQVSIFNEGINNFNCSATDNQGAVWTSTQQTIFIDTIAPRLSPSLPIQNISGGSTRLLLNSFALALPNASDATSGVATSSCDLVSTAQLGSHSLSCQATDNAGLSSQTTLNYIVGVNISVTVKSSVIKGNHITFKLAAQPTDAFGLALGTETIKTWPSCSVFAQVNNGGNTPEIECAEYNKSLNAFTFEVEVPTKSDGSSGTPVPTSTIVKAALSGAIIGESAAINLAN